jgi:hypothetical protein
MNIAIVGSREFPDLGMVEHYIRNLVWDTEMGAPTIISGGAPGVDTVAIKTAEKYGLPVEVIKPDWKTYGKPAGFRRNLFIVSKVDKVVAFWDGKSKGTKHTIDLTLQVGKCLEVHTPKCLG